MSKAVIVVAAVVATLGGGQGTDAGVSTQPIYIQADRLFTGRALISGRVAVAVRGGKVVAAGRLKIPSAARVVRFRGGTILPGIIDLHVHSTPASLLRAGVTTTRNTGQPEAALRPPYATRGYPRVVAAGPLITVPGGYPTGLDPGNAAPVKTVDEAAAKVDALIAKGAAFIKIAVAPGPAGAQPTLSLDQIRAIVSAAHRHRRIVTSHTLDGNGLALALGGGVDEIAHMPCVGVTREQLATLAERKVAVIGTLRVLRLVRDQCPDVLSNARTFVQEGGQLLYGTDIPGVPATLDLAELGLMQQAGLTPTRVLQAATADAGRELGMARLGTLARGAPADLWVVRGDPTKSLRALGRPLFVMARGKRVR